VSRLPLEWMPAAAYGGPFRPPAATFLTAHSTESENTTAMAEALAGPNWFGGPKAGTSSHKIVDVDSICEGVHRGTVAYHAGPGGNTWGIAYEFCGRASWSAAKWREPAQLQMLRNAAPHMADDLIAITGSRAAAQAACRWLSIVQVAQHQHGLCTHNDIRLALGGTTHSDPGPNFPYAELLAYVQAALGDTAAGAPASASTPAAPSQEDDDMPFLFSAQGRGVGQIVGDRAIPVQDPTSHAALLTVCKQAVVSPAQFDAYFRDLTDEEPTGLELSYIVDTPSEGIWFWSGDMYYHIGAPAQVIDLEAQGANRMPISQEMHDNLKAAFGHPASTA